MLEAPSVQTVVGFLPDAKRHLAAFGLTFSLSLLIESPVILLLTTAIALVHGRDSYRALRTFTIRLCLACTLLAALVGFTPLYDLVTVRVLGQPAEIVAAARRPLQLMLFWSALIGWRRMHQGLLVRHGYTRFVTVGTLLRLVTIIGVGATLVRGRWLNGAESAAMVVMAGVLVEAVATTLFAVPILKREILPVPEPGGRPPLTQAGIGRFHTPLAATTLLSLLAPPLTAAALARLESPHETLAVWPVVSGALLVLRGWGLAVQEITVAQARRGDDGPVGVFALGVGLVTTAATLAIAFSPLMDVYARALQLPPDLHARARLGLGACALVPLLSALGSWRRGHLVATGATRTIYAAMAIGLAVQALLLGLSVALRLPGMIAAAGAFTLGGIAELLRLGYRRSSRSSNAPA